MWPFTNSNEPKPLSDEERKALAAKMSAQSEEKIAAKIRDTLRSLPNGSIIISVKVKCVTERDWLGGNGELSTWLKIARAMWRDPTGQFYLADFYSDGSIEKAVLVAGEATQTNVNVSQTAGLIN